MATCGVAFPVGSDTIERLSQAGVGPDVIAAAVTGRYFFLLSDPSDQNIASILTHTQPGSVAPPFTADQKAEVLKATASPEVSAIRALFDRYRSAKNQMTSADDQRRVRLLDALPPDVVASPFSVLAVNPYAGGGEIVTIIFAKSPHLIVDVHVTADGVTFLRQKALPPEISDRIASYYRDLLSDPAYLR